MDYLTNTCRNCGGKFEFPGDGVGQGIQCPHCGKSLILCDESGKPSIQKQELPFGIDPKFMKRLNLFSRARIAFAILAGIFFLGLAMDDFLRVYPNQIGFAIFVGIVWFVMASLGGWIGPILVKWCGARECTREVAEE